MKDSMAKGDPSDKKGQEHDAPTLEGEPKPKRTRRSAVRIHHVQLLAD